MSIFGERIKKLRNERGITQKQAADDLEISPQTLSYYENGREASYDILIKMSKYYGVSVDYLLGIIDKYFYSETENINRLGLSDKAINTLVKLNSDESEKAAAEFLNKFISNANFKSFIESKENITAAVKVVDFIIHSTAFQRMIDLIAEKPLSEKLKADLLNMKIGDIVKMDDEHKAAVLEELFPLYQNEICKLKDFEVEQCINALQRELIVKYVKSLYVYPAEL